MNRTNIKFLKLRLFISLKIIILIASTFLAPESLANVPTPAMHPALKDMNSFKQLISNNWVFSCLNHELISVTQGDLNQLARDFVEETIFRGLRKLSYLNPDWVRERIDWVVGDDLRFTCPEINVAGGTAVGYEKHKKRSRNPNSSNEYLEDLVGTYNEIAINSVFWFVAYPACREELISTLKKNGLKIIDPLLDDEHTKSAEMFNRNVAFHEFLHFMDMDNYRIKIHSNLDEYSHIDHITEMDMIYACTAQIYPSERIYEKDGKQYSNTKIACIRCALAYHEDGKNKSSARKEDLDRAIEVCESVNDEDYLIF